MTVNFSLFVSYSQISVFNPSLRDPFNNWSSQHVNQGFSWRPGSVSFRTLSESGVHSVEILTAPYFAYNPSDTAVRVIEVPFMAQETEIEVASISESKIVTMEPGQYALRFCVYPAGKEAVPHVKFCFLHGLPSPKFELIKTDLDLAPESELMLTAEPATST